MSRTRQAVKPLNLDSKTVSRAAQADADRKAESKAALRKAAAAAKHATPDPAPVPVPRETDEAAEARHAEERANALKTAREDAEATGVTFEAMCEEMGIDSTTGAPAAPEGKPGYDGPMVALKTARTHYVKAANGILCNGDPLAQVCGAFARDVTVRALMIAMKLESNPYAHLNPGQQSMNLRNKARGMLKAGTLKIEDVKAAYTSLIKPAA